MQKKYFWFACLGIVCCRVLAAYVLPTFDDAFITYRYGQNLAGGLGLVYNAGEKIMGSTAPLFAVISAVPIFLHIPAPLFFVIFSLCCDLGSLYLIWKFFLKNSTAAGLLFAAVFAFDPIVNRIAIGGMEADLFLFLSLGGLVCYFNGRKNLAFGILAGAYFLRPEAVILLGTTGLYEWITTKKFPWKPAIISVVVLAIPLAMIYAYYGQILPQSVVAKSTVGRNSFANLLKGILFPHAFNYLLFPLAVFGFIRRAAGSRLLLLAGIWIGLYAAAYFLRGPWIWTWYIYSIEVVQGIFAALALLEMAKMLKVPVEFARWLPVVPVLAVAAWATIAWKNGKSGVETYVYRELQKDFETRGGLEKKVFLADDIGVLGYFTHSYIYDNQMLVTPDAAKYKSTRERVLAVKPDYLFVYTDTVYLGLLRNDPVVSKMYHYVKRYSLNGEGVPPEDYGKNEPIVYKQDYILYQKNVE